MQINSDGVSYEITYECPACKKEMDKPYNVCPFCKAETNWSKYTGKKSKKSNGFKLKDALSEDTLKKLAQI